MRPITRYDALGSDNTYVPSNGMIGRVKESHTRPITRYDRQG